MAKREKVESKAPLVGGKFGTQWGEAYAIVREVQAILHLRGRAIDAPPLNGAQDLVDAAAEQVWGVSEAGCAAEQKSLLEEAGSALLSAHAVLNMVLDKQHDEPVLRAALRLLALTQQRAGALFEGYSNLHKESVAGEVTY